MSNPVFNLSAFFGDKPWFKSVTAWGLVVYVAGSTVLDTACGAGLIGQGVCDTASGWVGNIGMVMTALGIRRAATSPNTLA